MRRISIIAALPVILFIAMLTLPMPALAQEARPPAPSPRPGGSPQPADTTAEDLVAAHNKIRAEEKLPPLKLNDRLNEAARAHARDMAEHGKLTHEGTDGSDPPKRIKRAGYVYKECGENVAYGQDSVGEAMRAWLESPPHRKNILGNFTEMGGAIAKGSDGTPYWCVDFGRPIAPVDPAGGPAAMIAAMNKARADASKRALRPDEKLARTAARFAREAARRKMLDGKDEAGKSPFDALKKEGYQARRLAMSLAFGDGDPSKIVESWLKDENERETLLSGFDRVGAGVATDSDGIPYWVVLLAQ